MTRRWEEARAEVEEWLARQPREIDEKEALAYIGGKVSKLRYFGLKVPSYCNVLKAPLTINGLPETEAAAAWNHIFLTSTVYESMSAAQAWYMQPKRFARATEHWERFVAWVDRIDNWAHSDSLSKFVAKCLEDAPERVLPTLVDWNQSDEPWKQRQSIVGMLYYASGRSKILPFETMIPLVERHLESPHFYVQKGVGWTLRELGNLYRKETNAFLHANVGRLGAYAFSAATEKMNADEKNSLKALRKAARTARSSKAAQARSNPEANSKRTP